MRKSELKEIIKSSFLAEAEDSKKGNSEEQKRAEGAIRDNKKHIQKLKKDLSFQEEKLAKLKKDSKRDVIKERSSGGYDDPHSSDEDIEFWKQNSEGKTNEGGGYNDQHSSDEDIEFWKQNSEGKTNEGLLDFLKKKKKEAPGEYTDPNPIIGVDYDGNYIRQDGTKDLAEAEDVDVEDNEDVDIDVEDTVDIEVDDEETESDIEVKTSVAGESTDVEAVQGLLTKAQAEAGKLGDDKLLDQIGNTITYFTRAHVVKSANEDLESGQYGDPEDVGLDVTKGGGDVAGILDAESELNLQEVKRFKKLAGLVK